MSSRPYFIGFELPAPLSDQIFAYKWQLHSETTNSLKPLIPHVTLLHPSSLRSIPQEDIIPDIREITAGQLPITFTVHDVDSFGQNVLYVRLSSPEVSEIFARLIELLPAHEKSQYQIRGFIPHITLLQTKSPHSLDIPALQHRARKKLTLPKKITCTAVSCFTQAEPRVYRASRI